MVLLLFHLVFSGFTFDGVDIEFSSHILDWNATRFPSGVFFLFGQGRMALFRADPKASIEFYTRALDVVQTQFKSLQGISLWELAVAHLAMWGEGHIQESLECWRKLKAEAGWSKAVYTYGLACCLVELSEDDDEKEKEGRKMMESVPGLMKKIAGKSIPMEVRDFISPFLRFSCSLSSSLPFAILMLVCAEICLAQSAQVPSPRRPTTPSRSRIRLCSTRARTFSEKDCCREDVADGQ
jgi:hypothetical protein